MPVSQESLNSVTIVHLSRNRTASTDISRKNRLIVKDALNLTNTITQNSHTRIFARVLLINLRTDILSRKIRALLQPINGAQIFQIILTSTDSALSSFPYSFIKYWWIKPLTNAFLFLITKYCLINVSLNYNVRLEIIDQHIYLSCRCFWRCENAFFDKTFQLSFALIKIKRRVML